MQATSFSLPNAQEKPAYVQTLFQRVAKYYDLMNDLMTFGLHRLWKHQACARLNLPQNAKALDVCCGTGDLAFIIHQQSPSAQITGLDFCPEMLAVARKRLAAKKIDATFLQGDALALPFEDNAFDGAIISYGLRNVADYQACLAEMTRVVKPGGSVVILDMSHPKGLANLLTSIYRFQLLPLLGKLIANDPDAYRYLSNSIFFYPTQPQLAQLMGEVGLNQVGYQNKLGGICALHWGQKA